MTMAAIYEIELLDVTAAEVMATLDAHGIIGEVIPTDISDRMLLVESLNEKLAEAFGTHFSRTFEMPYDEVGGWLKP